MVWRFVQALGASPGLAVGSGVIGDIYKLEERGQALGIYFGVILSFRCLRVHFFSKVLGCPSRPCSRSFGRG
jgi:hypothetical protein